MEDVGTENPHIVPLTDVELNKNYAMVISTSCGLWRYMIGDTVKFTNKHPYKFVITGRTKHFINAFGEELMVNKGWQKPARRPVHRLLIILLLLFSWMHMPSAVISG